LQKRPSSHSSFEPHDSAPSTLASAAVSFRPHPPAKNVMQKSAAIGKGIEHTTSRNHRAVSARTELCILRGRSLVLLVVFVER